MRRRMHSLVGLGLCTMLTLMAGACGTRPTVKVGPIPRPDARVVAMAAPRDWTASLYSVNGDAFAAGDVIVGSFDAKHDAKSKPQPRPQAIDGKTGTQRWEIDLPKGTTTPIVEPGVFPILVRDQTTATFFFTTLTGGGVTTAHAVDVLSGKKVWSVGIAEVEDPAWKQSVRGVQDDYVVIGSRGSGRDSITSVLDAATGELRWTREGFFAELTSATVIVGHDGAQLTALDPVSGTPLWTAPAEWAKALGAYAYGDRVAVGYEVNKTTAATAIVDVRTGAILGSLPFALYECDGDDLQTYVACWALPQLTLVGLDPHTGTEQFNVQVPPGTFSFAGGILAARGYIYAGHGNTGSIWTAATGTSIGERRGAPVSAGNGFLIFAASGHRKSVVTGTY